MLKPLSTSLLALTAWIVINSAGGYADRAAEHVPSVSNLAAAPVSPGPGSAGPITSTPEPTRAALTVEPSRPRGRLITERVASATLKRDIPLIVYLPPGYDHGAGRYPVVYLLHGAGGDERDWTGPASMQQLADRLIAAGAMPPAIIAMPGCRECWWVDGRRDRAETAFWSDLVAAVDVRYRTVGTRDGRFIAGLSAGGYGAIRFALKYPDRIGAVAAMSPAIYADTPPAASAARKQPPFLRTDGSFDEELWDARNYPSLLPAYLAQKYRVPMYLTAGDHDALGIAYETALLHKRLLETQASIAELRVLDGDHNWKLWSATLADALTFLFRHGATAP